MKPKVLLLDDELDMLEACEEALEGLEAEVTAESSSLRALERLRASNWDVLVSDIKMPRLDGLELLRSATEAAPGLSVILMTAFPSLETAVEALRHGAVDYVIKPFHPDTFRRSIERVLQERALSREITLLRRQVEKPHRSAAILGESRHILETLKLIDRVAQLPTDVLILGETGTGKELAARRLHSGSRRPGRFVPLDCGAIPEHLLENELFGHEKGAFTDARSASVGLLEFADRGTLFMDEIGEMPLSMQAKLLRTLQERQFRRVGGKDLISVDMRVIAATNRDLAEEIRRGNFREDLYYRINPVQVRLPPIRERPGDVALLAREFTARFARELGRPVTGISAGALEVLERYRWPGNIRELENAIKRAVALCEGEELGIDDLPETAVLEQAPGQPDGFVGERARLLAQFEARYLRGVLERHSNDVRAAAAEARIPISTFYRLLKKHSLNGDKGADLPRKT